MLTIRRLFIILALCATLLAVAGCAKQGYPSGGPKDETPPVVTSTVPPNGSLNFDANEFYLQFDEYVTVKDADNNILVSPPMKQKPEYKTKGRGIVAKLKDTLLPNTTYLFQFKEAITDFNEGNALPSFEYVFSTGGSIDSMTLRGTVVDAFSRKPRTEPVTVLAWAESQQSDSVGDSLVAKVQPLYITRCDKEGNFALNHLRSGRYLLLALEDGDKNLRLNSDEPMAFLDSLVTAAKMLPPPDTARRDSTAQADTNTLPLPDTATAAPSDTMPQPTIPALNLLMSQDKHEKQRISKSAFVTKGRIEIITQTPLSHRYTLRSLPADSTATPPTVYHRLRPKGDTLDVWTTAPQNDTVTLLLHDTTGLNDTLHLKYKAPSQSPSPTRTPKSLAKSKPRIAKSLVAASHPWFDTLWIGFENPIDGICEPWRDTVALDTAVQVLNLTDSTASRCGLRLAPDTLLAPATAIKAFIDFDGKPGTKYQFTVPAGLFYDIFQNQSDSLTIVTEFTKTESYGNIYLTLTSQTDTAYPTPLIVQLTNEKGETLRQHTATQPGKLSFIHLKGGKYSIRAIVDTDHNGRWTPGNYWQHRQPENVLLFEKTLELRENWDMEEKWEIDIDN